ncbi:MAG TPA: ribonucleoside-diphosphate reductase, adenosylcobalamin-dependent, partial [Bacteroidales bacterium]|nr:ribonucleoside-diphosphate reductase, adenosylcobalamin-dependent [Bacteroidales bacterium]
MNKGEISFINGTKEKRKVYSFDEAIIASTEYFKGDEMAAKVWVSKYALKDSFGNIYECSPEDMHRRLAKEIARIESKYANPMSEEDIFNLLKEFKYIVPQGGPMTGIGNPFQIASLSNCFVIGSKG